MKKPLKDKKIILYQEIKGQTPGGMPFIKFVPIHPEKLWAYVRQLSASEFYAAAATQQAETIKFIINYRPDVTQTCSVCYKGIFYNIIRVDIFEGYKSDLALFAELRVDQPQPEQIFPH